MPLQTTNVWKLCVYVATSLNFRFQSALCCAPALFAVWLGFGAKKHLVRVRKRLYFGLLSFVATNTDESVYQLPNAHLPTAAAINQLAQLATQLAIQTESYGTGEALDRAVPVQSFHNSQLITPSRG